MKLYSENSYNLRSGWLLLIALAWAGCAQIDTTPAGNPDRVLNGTVNFNATLPAGAEVTVRLIEPAAEIARLAGGELAIPNRSAVRNELVLGEARQVVEAATQQPVPFQVAYHAEDGVLRRGVNLDVRVSVGGKVRWRTINAHVVTLASSPFRQEVWVQPVQ
jgi:uncharacterized lipoprotein YbaY